MTPCRSSGAGARSLRRLSRLLVMAVLLNALLLQGAISEARARPPAGGGGSGGSGGGGGGSLQRAFQELKQLEREKLTEEQQLIEASRRCVEAAQNLRSLHDCHRREREAEWEQRERFHRRIEAVRARYGIGPPRRDGGGPPQREGPPPPF